MTQYLLRRHVAQHKLQTTAEHRHRHFLRIGGRQYEFHMLRRLFQRFEHGIEGRLRQHVHFVDDIDFVATHARRVLGVFQHLTNVVNARIGSRIDFHHIHMAACIDLHALCTFATRLTLIGMLTIEAFGQNAGDGGFAHPARTG